MKVERLRNTARTEYKQKDKEVKHQIRKDRRQWIEDISRQAEEAARGQDMRTVYELTKVLCNERPKRISAIKDKDGNLLTGCEERKRRWTEHFREVLNRDEPSNPIIDNEIMTNMHQLANISVEPPTVNEVRSAIMSLKNGKAGGDDMIVAELLKADPDFSAEVILELFQEIWREERILRNWRRGLIVKLAKKGDLKDCKNWRGITLLAVISKVLGRVLIERIRTGIDDRLRNEQAGFRTGRGTTEQIFILRNIIEQSYEWQASLFINFVDFEKAFDSVHRESLWKIMQSYGIPMKIVNLVKVMYDDFKCAVIDEGVTTEWFSINSRVKQGCNMSEFLFLIVFD